MINTRKELGAIGERLAARYLISKGYEILERNWRSGYQEIDLIVMKNSVVVFCEIKTRVSMEFAAAATILKTKQWHGLKKALATYAWQKKINLEHTRLDLLIIIFSASARRARIQHLEDIG